MTQGSIAKWWARPTTSAVLFTIVISAGAIAQTQQNTQSGTTPEITVTGQPISAEDWKAKLDHIMKEVSGTEITVTKKATVIKLDQQPPIQNNNLQEQFTKAPGLIVSEQQNPGQIGRE